MVLITAIWKPSRPPWLLPQALIDARRTELQDKNLLIVSESGIHTPDHVETVQAAGADAILVGESLVKQPDPGQAIDHLLASQS